MRISDWSSDVCSSDLVASSPNSERRAAPPPASVGALDAELDEFLEGGAVRVGWKTAQGLAGGPGIIAGAVEGGFQRAVPDHQALRLDDVVVALVEVLDGALPERPLDLVARLVGEDHRQGDLALAEVVSDGLAQRRLLGGVVEDVVDQLEGDPEVAAEAFQGRFLGLRSFGDDRSDLGGGGEQLRGLAADHLEIVRLGGERKSTS